MNSRATAAFLFLTFAGLAASGCAQDRSRITPTTSGTDLRAIPRGRMTPQPFPGSSLAREAVGDPALMTVSGR